MENKLGDFSSDCFFIHKGWFIIGILHGDIYLYTQQTLYCPNPSYSTIVKIFNE